MFDNDDDGDFTSSEDIFGSSNYGAEERLDGGGSIGEESYDLDELTAPGSDENTMGGNNDNSQSFGDSGGGNKGRKEVIKCAVIAIVGILMLLLAAVGLRKYVNSHNGNNSKPAPVINKTADMGDGEKEAIDNKEINTNGNGHYIDIGESQSSEGEWIKFNGGETFEFSGELESTFTVTSIDCYAMVSNSYNDKTVKVVLTGNISGMVGTYKLEIPFDKMEGLSVGVSFKCYYKLADTGNYKVVTGIRY